MPLARRAASLRLRVSARNLSSFSSRLRVNLKPPHRLRGDLEAALARIVTVHRARDHQLVGAGAFDEGRDLPPDLLRPAHRARRQDLAEDRRALRAKALA